MEIKVGDVVVSKCADLDIEVGERFTVKDVTCGGQFINFVDKEGDLRDRPAYEFELVSKTLAATTLADVEVKQGMRFKVNLEGVCPIQLAKDIKVQADIDTDPFEEGFLIHGFTADVVSVDSDGELRVGGYWINPGLFKYLELVIEPKELVKGKAYIVRGVPKVFLGTDGTGGYLFSSGGLKYAVADGADHMEFISAQQQVITFLTKADAEALEEA